MSQFYWARGQPNNGHNEDYGLIHLKAWHDATANRAKTFFCYNVFVVKEKKTWEEALEHCREHHSDLASVSSETEMLLIRKELDKENTTDKVWIGLHFFPGRWLWVDGQPLSYEAWGGDIKPECPEVKLECAALQVKARKSNGTDATPSSNAAGLPAVVHSQTIGEIIAPPNRLNNTEESDAADGVETFVWNAHNCEERLHFICY